MTNVEDYAEKHALDPAKAGEIVMAAAITDAKGNFGMLLLPSDLQAIDIKNHDSKERVIEKIRQVMASEAEIRKLVGSIFNENVQDHPPLNIYVRGLLIAVLDWVEK